MIGDLFGGAASGAAAAGPTDLTSGVEGLLGDIAQLDPSFMTSMQQLNSFLEGNWMNTALGEQVDSQINNAAQSLFGGPIIGNGTDGTAADPDGGEGGIFFGNGGNGSTYDASTTPTPGVAINGGSGGDAAFFGNGGAGGTGGDGVAGTTAPGPGVAGGPTPATPPTSPVGNVGGGAGAGGNPGTPGAGGK